MKRFCVFCLIFLLLLPSALAEEKDTARYEAQLMELLRDEMGMPRDRELKAYRGFVRTGEEEGAVIDSRPRYGQSFHAMDRPEAAWNGWMALDSGTLIVAEAHYNDEWISLKEEKRLDPAAPKWEEMAKEHLKGMRKRGLDDVAEIIQEGEIRMNGVYGVSFRFVLQNGGVYTVHIVYALNQVVEVIYRDAVRQANYEEAVKKQKIVNQ